MIVELEYMMLVWVSVDSYTLLDPNGVSIDISGSGIAWPDDKAYKYKNIDLSR
jgi:hypothetical protein